MNVHRYMHVHKNQLKSPEHKIKSPPPKGKITVNTNKTNVTTTATATATGGAVAVRAPFGKVDTNHISAMNHTNAKTIINKPLASTTTTTSTKSTTTTKPTASTTTTKKRRSNDAAVRVDENGQIMKKRRSVGKSTPTPTCTSTYTPTDAATTETPTGNITTELLDDALALLKQKLDATIPSTPTKDTITLHNVKSPASMPTPPSSKSTFSYLTSITTSMITRVADHVLDKVKDKMLIKKEEYVSLPVPAPAPEDEIILSSINDETPASPTHDTSRFQKLLTRDTPRRRPRSSMVALLAPRQTSIDVENGMKAMSDVRCDVKKRKMGGNGGPLVDIDEDGDGKKSMLTRVTSFIHKPSTSSSRSGVMSPVPLHLSHDDTIPSLPLSPSPPDEIQQAYDDEEFMDDGTHKFRHHYRIALEKRLE